jgi:hypothetical protein
MFENISEPILNSNIFSFDSTEGIVIIVLLAFAVWCFAKKFLSFAWWCLGLILFFQVMYVIGKTPINDVLPVANIFKYDVFSAIGQLCPNTKLASALTWLGTAMSNIFLHVSGYVVGGLKVVFGFAEKFFESIKPIGT